MEAKKIIITGGATRIGAAIAKSLVSFDTKIVIHFNRSKSSALKLKKELESQEYQYGFTTDIDSETFPVGLNEDIVKAISKKKNE